LYGRCGKGGFFAIDVQFHRIPTKTRDLCTL